LVTHTAFGLTRAHRRLTVEDRHGAQSVVTWWRGAENPVPGELFDLVFIPRINDYKGRKSLQLEYVDSRPVPGYEVDTGPRYEVVDLRGDPSALDLAAYGDYLLWAEPPKSDALITTEPERIASRETARRCKTLVIWTAPPHVEALAQMLDLTGARTVVIVGQGGPDDTVSGFLEKLAGLVKYAQKNYPDGVPLVRIASALSQREVTVRRGLEWMAARGAISLEWTEDEQVRFGPGGAGDAAAVEPLQDAIRALLAESRAYRAYFKRADLSVMIR
jgi:single-stranded-DNA-specific exonuclease